MTEVAGGADPASQATDDVALVRVDEPRDSHSQPKVITTTATGASIDLSQVIGDSAALQQANQALLESRKDFHTHPRSLALAHMQVMDWQGYTKIRTTGALLVVCLNLGIDPPDLVRPKNCAKLEAWVDPTVPVQVPTPEELALQAAKSGGTQHQNTNERTPLNMIGENLHRQFEVINRHASYRTLLDCAMESMRKACVLLRRKAKDERVMFYYNGHGVPRPTASGDIWVFNKQFTQYIPVSAMDLMSWVGTPGVYVWDCSHAMNVVQAFEKTAKARDMEIARIKHAAEAAGTRLPLSRAAASESLSSTSTNVAAMLAAQMTAGATQSQQHQAQSQQQQQQQQQSLHGSAGINPALINLALLPSIHHKDIHFAATQADELLPTNPELPADLFTSCLTTPIKAALRFWVIRNPRTSKVTLDMCEKLPGSVQERRTPFGELNWIFTAITDTIAWNTLSREQFYTLFRLDVTVASLFRNFMLADRIMRFYGVHPQSRPSLPPTHKHPLWDSLDLEIDMCLQQLPRLLAEDERRKQREEKARRSEHDRIARANARRGNTQLRQSKQQMELQGISPIDFEGPPRINLEIAGSFKRPSRRSRGARAGLGGIESDDDESSNDSDDAGVGISAVAIETNEMGYISSTYFSNQLYAFEVWLQHAATVVSQFVSDHGPDEIPRSLSTEPPPDLEAPNELPAVLQVLLSQQYRLRALILLYRFMNLGPWAVNLALGVGIFPYVSKLLASTTAEIREILILVWARLIAVDLSLRNELLKNNGMAYFVAYLANNIQMQHEPVSEKVRLCDTVSAASAFTLALLCTDAPAVQQACFNERVLDYFLVYLQRPDNGTDERGYLRTWILMCLAELWRGFPNAKWMAMTYRLCVIASNKQQQQQSEGIHEDGEQASAPSFEELLASSADDANVDARDAQDLLIQMAFHRVPSVRTAAIYAMGTLVAELSQLGDGPGVLTIVQKTERQIYALLLQASADGSPMVRCEVVRVISSAVFASYMPQAIEAVSRTVGEELHLRAPATTSDAMQDLITKLWKAMLKLSTDAHPDVSLLAQETCDILFQCYAHSQQFFANETSLDQAICKLELASGQQSLLGSATSIGEALLGRPPSVSRHDSTSSIGPAGTRPINGSVPAHHRHTMHLSPGSLPHAPTPRTPSVAGSVHVNLADRFADMGNAQPADTTQKLSEIEQAWMDWGRKELRDQSSFLDWAGAHFTEFDISLFANVSGPLHDSKTLVESRERNRHVDRMETSSRVMSSQSSTMKWMDVRPVATIKEPATTAILHPLEPHAIVASSRGTVSVFDWEAHAQVGHYSIGAQDTSSDAQTIGNLHLINPLGQSKLLVSSRDGKVRIFASYAPDFKPSPSPLEQFPRPRLLTAFTAMPWSSHGSSFSVEGCEMVTAWNQRSGILFAGGNDKEVRIWDITAEMCIEEIAVASMGGVTCLSHDGMAGNIFAVGNANGSVRVMDRRLSARTGVVANWREHCPSKICNVSMLAGQAEVVSASENGDVKYWDLRHAESAFTLSDTHPDQQLEYMVTHERAPIILSASSATVKIWNRRGTNIGTVAANRNGALNTTSYMKTLAGYGAARIQQPVRVAAAALHGYLPIALMVSDDGQISYIQPTKSGARPSNMTISSRSSSVYI